MRKVLRINALLLSLVFVLVTVISSGCSQKAENQTTTAASATTATASTTAPQETTAPQIDISKPVNLKYYTYGGVAPTSINFKDLPLVQEELNKYLKEKINTTVEVNYIAASQFSTKMNMMLAANEEVDVTWQGSKDYWSNVAKGAYHDITDLMDIYMPKTKALSDGVLLEGTKFKGRNYGNMTLKELTYPMGIHIRTDLTDKYNLDYTTIKKLEDIEPFLKVIKENEPSITWPVTWTGTAILYDDLYDNVILDLIGISYANEGKAAVTWDDPAVMDGFKLIRKWYELGYINKDLALGKNVDQNSGQNFIFIRSLAPFANLNMNPKYKWAEIPMTDMRVTTTRVSSQMTVVPKSSKNLERALMFIELLNTDRYTKNTLLYGIEGTHFVKVKENPVVVIDFAPGLTRETTPWYPNNSVNLGNFLLDYIFTGQAENRVEYYTEWNSKCKPSPYLGFNFDSSNVQNELGACNNVKAQYLNLFMAGAVDPEVEYPKYREKLTAAGIETILAEVQKQLDEFMASKKK